MSRAALAALLYLILAVVATWPLAQQLDTSVPHDLGHEVGPDDASVHDVLAALQLAGRIEGTRNGTPRSVDYPMRRVDCPR